MDAQPFDQIHEKVTLPLISSFATRPMSLILPASLRFEGIKFLDLAHGSFLRAFANDHSHSLLYFVAFDFCYCAISQSDSYVDWPDKLALLDPDDSFRVLYANDSRPAIAFKV